MTTPTVTMVAPASFGGAVTNTPSGTTYVPNASGQVSALYADITTLASLGFTPVAPAMQPVFLPSLGARNSDGSTLAAAAASGKFGVTFGTPGTNAPVLISEVANNNAKSDTAVFEMVLPQNYAATGSTDLVVNCNVNIGSGTLSVKTMTATMYLAAKDSTEGSQLITGGAQTIPSAAGDLSFPVTDTTLLPGTRVIVELVAAITETAASAVTMQINSVRLHN